MFQLTPEEVESSRSQSVILNTAREKNSKRGRHRKYRPYLFTEQWVAMLSSVLRSESGSVLMNEWRLLHPRLIMRALLHESFKIKICV